jgi:hypothetical protein
VKVIEVDGQYLIQASGREVTVLEDAMYQRALQLEGHASDWRSRQHPELLGKMLAAVRRPYEARRASAGCSVCGQEEHDPSTTCRGPARA